MTSVPFDTLKLATKLEQTGLTPEQAKGAAAAFREAFSGDLLATKDDVEAFRLATKADLSEVKAEIPQMDARSDPRISERRHPGRCRAEPFRPMIDLEQENAKEMNASTLIQK